jgi:fluoroquinolone resistance protein
MNTEEKVFKSENFSGKNLEGRVFASCTLAVRYNIDPQTNKIKKAKFSLPEAIGLLRGFDVIIE